MKKIRRNPERETSVQALRRNSRESAKALAKIINDQPGAPQARAWIPEKEGYAPRVYVGNAGYLTVSGFSYEGERLNTYSERKQQITLAMRNLYPAQRSALNAALKVFREEYLPGAMRREDELQESYFYAMAGNVLAAIRGGASTRVEIMQVTGLSLRDVMSAISYLKEQNEIDG